MESEYISLSTAAKLLPNRPSTSSIWRWCRKGIKSRGGQRIALRHVRIGGTIHTTEEFLEEFIQDLAAADAAHFAEVPHGSPPPAKPRTASRRKRDIETAEAELANAGM